MKLRVHGIDDGQPIPETFAFGVYNEQDHMSFGPNRNPELTWEDAPEGTRSFVVLMFDPDVPSVADDVNQEGRVVPRDLPRVDFFHWVLVDIPASVNRIPEGEDSDGVRPKGKAPAPVRSACAGSTTTLSSWPAIRTWPVPTPVTTDPVRPGTTSACITTTSKSMRWTWTAWACPVSLTATMCARP